MADEDNRETTGISTWSRPHVVVRWMARSARTSVTTVACDGVTFADLWLIIRFAFPICIMSCHVIFRHGLRCGFAI